MNAAARLVAICGAVICTSASAAAAPPKGRLTHAEYRQLSAGMSALNRSIKGQSVNWARARAACRAMGRATDLLKTQRASCLSSVATFESLASFPREQRTCSRRIKTTTTTTTTTATTTAPTTTTPGDPAVIRLLICMSPHYQAIARYSRRLDAGAIAARKAVVARRFRGSCLAAMAPTSADLKKAKLFASATGRLAADVGLLIRVTEGKAPASDFNQAKVDTDVRQFEQSASAVLDEHGQPKLSVCPHE